MRKLLTIIPAVLLAAACAKEIRPGFDDGRVITFAVAGAGAMQVEESTLPETRSALVNDASSSFAFGVSEYNGSTAVSTFQNLQPAHESTISTDNELFNSHRRWEAPAYTGTDYSFYAYAPYLSASAHGMTLQDGNRKIAYSLSGLSIANMPDLMTAYAESDYQYAVPLTFQHRLAAVGITLGTGWASGTTVSAIRFANIITGGTLAVSAGKDAAWDSYGSRGSYTVPSGFSTTASTAGSVILGASSTWLMMVPQTLSGNDASIVVTISKGGSTYTVTLPLSGKWEAGKTYVYTVDPAYYTGMTAVYPKWDDGSASGVDGPVTAYDTGSNIFGLYAVDTAGNLVMTNIPVGVSSVDGRTATLSLPTGYYSAQYRYFLYYPYKQTGPGSVTESATTAMDFFAGVISSWSVSGTQNNLTDFKAQDLQVGMLTGTSFTMSHAMGLAKITLANKSIATTRTYTYGTSTTFSDSGTTSQAPPGFSSTTRLYSSSGYWTILKATGAASNTAVTFTSTTGTHGDSWSLTVSDAGYGKYKEFTIQTSLEFLNYIGLFPFTGSLQTAVMPFAGTYKLEVWGAQGCSFTHNSITLRGGYGGYSVGNMSLSSGQTLYVMVGGRGRGGLNDGGRYTSFPNGGPGGAPNLQAYSGSGGGSTHIATSSELPKALTDAQILIMAGGGGAADCDPVGTNIGWGGHGGSGGGIQGNSGTEEYSSFIPGTGGSQTAGGVGGWRTQDSPYTALSGSKGQGGGSYGNDCTGGGGGYYGGGGSWGAGGGGGSGYLNSSLTNKQMVGYALTTTSNAEATKTVSTNNVSETATANYAKSGDGYATITSQ
jgi:hypothetical protein